MSAFRVKSVLSSLLILAAAWLAVGLTAPEATASPVQLGRLLRSPVGRFLLTETSEGSAFIRKVLGTSGASYEDDVARLIRQLYSTREMETLAAELRLRLDRIDEAFRTALSIEQSLESREVLRQLASRVLKLESSRLQFTPMQARGSTASRRAFAQAGAESTELARVSESAGQASQEMSEEALKALAEQAAKRNAGANLRKARFQDGMDGSELDLRFANLSESSGFSLNFEGSRMEWADLVAADLRAVRLRGADLTGARLHRTKLAEADLTEAVLADADLTRANLAGADLRGADLRGADLTGAYVEDFFFRMGVSARFEGAYFDARTKLPFSRAEAERAGMIFIGG